MFHRHVAFDGNKIRIDYSDESITELLDFLFLDLDQDGPGEVNETFVIKHRQKAGDWRLKLARKPLFTGKNLAGMGVVLMGEVLFHLIKDNENALAIHAGLVSDNERTILIPGASGSGKTSFTTWLLCSGMRYHTDELVTINLQDYSLKAFTRPLNVKTSGVEAVRTLFDMDGFEDDIRVSRGVTMIPHRLVNPEFNREVPKLTHVIFPKYIAESKSEIDRLSGAEAGLELMRSNVIARNLPTHGFGQVTKLVRDLPAYRLHYRHFDDLPGLMEQIS